MFRKDINFARAPKPPGYYSCYNIVMLAYTFRTFPNLHSLKDVFPDMHIFGPLKESLTSFRAVILAVQPEFILGVA